MVGRVEGDLRRERRLSAFGAAACAGLAIVIPIIVAAFWTFASWPVLALFRLVPFDIIHTMPGDVHLWQRAAGGAIDLIPALLISYGLLRARSGLLAFSRGDFFADDVIGGLRGYAAATFWAAIASILAVPVLSATVTMANAPVHHRELSADLGGAQIMSLLGAAIVWVIASAIARAREIARENEQFV